METRIQFDRLGIAEAIKRNRLKVPLNQREYAWETEHVRDLLTDIANSMQKQREVYFLGTLVLTTNPQGFLEVADGQQRLATTTLILTAFRDIFLGLDDEMRAKSLENDFLFTIDISERELLPRLALNADDNQFFCSTILARHNDRDKQIGPTRTSHHKLQDAFQEIKSYFASLQTQVGGANYADSLLRWVKFLQNGATVITLTVPDDLDAFVMFETLNDRGLKTSQADLVKNHLFKEAGDRRTEAQVSWSSMRGGIESIGEDDLTIDFLRHVCNLLYGQTRERDVFEKIKGANRGAGESIRFLSLLGELAQDYAAILNPDHPKWNGYPPNIRSSVRTLNLLNVAQIRPLLLGAARHLGEKVTAQSFERFVAWCVRFIICGGARGGDLERKYCDMGNAIHTGKIKTIEDLDAAAKTVVPTNAQFEASFSTARVNVAKLARYMLRSLERSASEEPNPEWVVNEETVINLEHVMPGAALPKEWPDVTPQDIEAHANRLGNLVLLQANVNEKLDRADFATKRKAYAKSSFLLTSQVSEVLTWGVSEIETRQKTLAKLAVKTWKVG